jgi:hypothetical protein
MATETLRKRRSAQGNGNTMARFDALGHQVAAARGSGKTAPLTSARPMFPAILRFRVRDRLPLHVRNRVGPAPGERLYVIFSVSGTGTGRTPGGRARMLPLEFPRHLTRSIIRRRDWSGHERHHDRDDDRASRQCHASHTRRVVTTAVQKMIPSDARASSPRVGTFASWPAIHSSWPSIAA